ncbi:MAG: hypothetical protein MUC63_02435, partial [Planctomycetes bacterium]|nr:hypothetical protein [Planctomycetota bacterium]
ANLEANALAPGDQPSFAPPAKGKKGKEPVLQLTLFSARPSALIQALKALDPDRMTPLEALMRVKELRDLAEKE